MLSPVESQPELTAFEDQIAPILAAHNFFDAEKPIHVARAPGRLDLMGGNVDYTGGMVLQSLLREAVWVAVQPRRDNVIRLLNPGAAHFGWQPSLEAEVADLSDIATLRLLCNRNQSTH